MKAQELESRFWCYCQRLWGFKIVRNYPEKYNHLSLGQREDQQDGSWGGFPAVAAVTLGVLLNIPEVHFLHLGNQV